MPDFPGVPTVGYPLSLAELARIRRNSPLFHFLRYFAFRDVRFEKDDFDRAVIDSTNLWAVAGGGGAAQVNFAINIQENGFIRGTTGTASGDTTTCTIIGPKTLYGDRQAGMEIKYTPITAVTETRIEVGFVDVIPGSTKSIVNVLATPSVNTSVVDAAVCTYDHTGTTTTNQLTVIGTSIAATLTAYTPQTARVAATSVTTRIQLAGPAGVGNQVAMWDDGVLAVPFGADRIEGGSAVAVVALIRASNGTSKSLDIDYIARWALRK